MKRRGRLGAELAMVLLVLTTLAGSLALIVAAQRRSLVPKAAPMAVSTVVQATPAPKAEIPPKSTPRIPEPEPPAEDPTPKAVAKIASEAAEEARKTAEADRKAEALEIAAKSADEEADRWRNRQSLLTRQVDLIEEKAKAAEDEADALARDRDALGEIRDKAQAGLNRAKFSNGMAVLPYRGPSGTWRRPIAIECANGEAKLQPNGPSFGLFEMSKLAGVGSGSPIVRAVARVLTRAGQDVAPDGGRVVPYILFVVRPDGVRPYYEARARLEPLGIAFGYELVDKETQIEFPDLDDPAEWRDAASGESQPTPPPTRARPDREVAAFEGGPAWPPQAAERPADPGPPPRRGTYANSAMVRGQADPRRRLDVDPEPPRGLQEFRRQLTQDPPAPNGRIELTENEDAVIPSLSPTPPSAGSPGGDDPSTGPGAARLPVVPGRSAPGGGPFLARGGNATPTSPSPLGSGSGSGSGSAVAMPPAGRSSPTTADPGGSGSRIAAPPAGLGGGESLGSSDAPKGGAGENAGQYRGSGSKPGTDRAGSGADPIAGSLKTESDAGAGLGSNFTPGSDLVLSGPNEAGGGSEAGKDPSATSGTDSPGAGKPGAAPDRSGTGKTGWKVAPGGSTPGGPGSNPAEAPGSTGDPATETPGRAGSQAPKTLAGMSNATAKGADPADLPFSTPPTTTDDSTSRPPRSLELPPIEGDSGGSDAASATDAGASGSSDDPGSGKAPKSASAGSARGAKGSASNPLAKAASGMSGSSQPPAQLNLPPILTIEPRKVAFEVVIACGPKGVTVHPGGYRFSTAKIDDQNEHLVKTLRSLERAQKRASPKDDVRPALKFLIEPGGQAAYHKAREHILLGGVNWPSAIKVVESNPLRVFAREAW